MPRYFLAVALPKTLRHALSDYSQTLQAKALPQGLRLRWEPSQNFHITLRFFGELDDVQCVQVQEITKAIVTSQHSFALRCTTLNAFPNDTRPRVLWLGIEDIQARLFSLQAEIQQAMDRAKLGKSDAYPYHPHVTLARVQQNTEDPKWLHRWQMQPIPEFGPFAAQEIVLYQSQYGDSGARYEAAFRFPLSPRKHFCDKNCLTTTSE